MDVFDSEKGVHLFPSADFDAMREGFHVDKQTVAENATIISVLSMGKCGSSTIYKSLHNSVELMTRGILSTICMFY